jgi:hypothetical protein
MPKKIKPTVKDNSLYAKTKYVNKNMHLTDNENNHILSDSLSEEREFKAWLTKRIEQFKSLGFSEDFYRDDLIYLEFGKVEGAIIIEKRNRERLEAHLKLYPLTKKETESLFRSFEVFINKEPDHSMNLYNQRIFDMKFDPLSLPEIAEECYMIGKYDDILKSFRKQYAEKWKHIFPNCEDDYEDQEYNLV